jgi:hypothetical protein
VPDQGAGGLADRADQIAEEAALWCQLTLLLQLLHLLQLLLLLKLLQLLKLLELLQLLQLLQLLRIDLLLHAHAARRIGRKWRQVPEEVASHFTNAPARAAVAKPAADAATNGATKRAAKHAAQALWCKLWLSKLLLKFIHGASLRLIGRAEPALHQVPATNDRVHMIRAPA